MDDCGSWYRKRTYAHFDRPVSKKSAFELVSDPSAVASHAFWPVILNPQKAVSLKEKNGRRVFQAKYRPIAYAAHGDSHIYAYYAQKLSCILERRYDQYGGSHALAYRKFTPPRCNVHFAFEAFNEMVQRQSCDVVAVDVEGFFDSLDHNLLKEAWCALLGQPVLPADHFAVFKACTRGMAVTLPTLRDVFKGTFRRRAGKTGTPICTPKEFRSCVKPLLQPRSDLVWAVKRKSPPPHLVGRTTGIPQGLPISAVLANVYMFESDQHIKAGLEKLGGSYRRYSDDVLLIVPAGKGEEAEKVVAAELSKVFLTVNKSKTVRSRIRPDSGSLKSFTLDESFRELDPAATSYLGLLFDGQDVRVRDSTISKFMIKAHRAIGRAKISAKKNSQKSLRRRQLYARLTSLGYGDAYGKANFINGERLLPKGAPRLGFFKYLRLAYRITASDQIKKQIRQVEGQIYRAIDAAEKEL